MTGKRAPADDAKRVAALDIGTNSIRLIVAEASRDASYRVIDDEKIIARLGAGLASTGRLDSDRVRFAAEAIDRLRDIAQGYGVSRLRAVATAAVREASNGDELVDLVRETTGLEVEVISAEAEAKLTYRSVANAFDLRSQNAVIVDVGGGSTEVLLTVGGVVEKIYTLPIGAVKLTDLHGPCDDPRDEQFHAMRDAIQAILKDTIERPDFAPQIMFGTGGTFTTMATVSMHRNAPPGSPGDLLPFTVRGYEMQRSEVRHILDWLRKMPVSQRERVAGLPADRAPIIVAGVLIIDRVLRRFDVNRLQAHDGGIRDGLILTLIDEIFGRRDKPAPRRDGDRIREVVRFAAKCNYEARDAHHVATLALNIYDQLAEHLAEDFPDVFKPENRELLHAASLLRDVGYLVNYTRHHKHTYHLVVHSDLRGFSPRDREIVANIARYHRRSLPKIKHTNFAKLSEPDRETVQGLAAILRVADGLDRTHTQSVTGVRVEMRPGVCAFLLDADRSPAVNVWGAQRKAKLFDKYFGVEPVFEWVQADAPDAPAADEPVGDSGEPEPVRESSPSAGG